MTDTGTTAPGRLSGRPRRDPGAVRRRWLAEDTELQPDLVVAPRAQFTTRDLPRPPLLAVEVLSPSTRRIDLLLKRDRLQAAGAPSSWLVEPDTPSPTALELRDGTHVEVARVEANQTRTGAHPWTRPC